jgi:hypothetical protein
MLFRTRDFLLFILTIAFLVVGIASTIGIDLSAARQKAALITFSDSNEVVIYSAVLPETPSDTRSSRLAELKDKVLNFLDSHDDILQEAEIEEVVTTEDIVDDEFVVGQVMLCPGYTRLATNWQTSGLKFEIVEGARIVYRENTAVVPSLTSTTSDQSLPNVPDVVVQLPLRTAPLANKTCLASDVVGIALDGSLIRNNEHTIYQVFSETSLVGYALDGFPIYGLSTQKTDNCGGTMAAGDYRYYLSSERDGVVGCFSGVPTSIK